MTTPGAVRRIQRSDLGQLEWLAEGSQGVVYRTESLKIARTIRGIYKDYKPTTRREIDVPALDDLVGVLFGMPQNEGQELINMAAWPVMTVIEGNITTGFVMPEVPAKFLIKIRLPSGAVSTKLAQFQFLLNKTEICERQGILADDGVRLQLLASVARDLAFLHDRGIAVGDLSPKNLLFSLGAEPDTHFVDCDAMAVNGASVMTQLETPDWRISDHCPAERLGTPASDVYKLSLLTVRMFARDQSTKDLDPLPMWIKANFRKIIGQSWSTTARDRPNAQRWSDLLQDACCRYADGSALRDRPTIPWVRPGSAGATTQPSGRRAPVVPSRGATSRRTTPSRAGASSGQAPKVDVTNSAPASGPTAPPLPTKRAPVMPARRSTPREAPPDPSLAKP